jgi:hypothetical protein
MGTVLADVITPAFSKIGIQSASTAQQASALVSLNSLMSLEGADYTVPCLTRESFALTIADEEYTIGTGGNFNTARPIKLENCFLRDSVSFDYPLRVISPKDYNDLPEKTFTGTPQYVYFVPEYPLAKIIFDKPPYQAYDAYFDFWKNFTEFALTSTPVTLPNEYKAFLTYNLAVSLAEDWDRKVSQSLYAMAKESKEIIGAMVASTKPAPRAKFEHIYGSDVGKTNILTDEYIDGGAF